MGCIFSARFGPLGGGGGIAIANGAQGVNVAWEVANEVAKERLLALPVQIALAGGAPLRKLLLDLSIGVLVRVGGNQSVAGPLVCALDADCFSLVVVLPN